MTINYTTEPIQPQRTYPWVGRCDKGSEFTIVLFTKPNTGFWLESTQLVSKKQTSIADTLLCGMNTNSFLALSH